MSSKIMLCSTYPRSLVNLHEIPIVLCQPVHMALIKINKLEDFGQYSPYTTLSKPMLCYSHPASLMDLLDKLI